MGCLLNFELEVKPRLSLWQGAVNTGSKWGLAKWLSGYPWKEVKLPPWLRINYMIRLFIWCLGISQQNGKAVGSELTLSWRLWRDALMPLPPFWHHLSPPDWVLRASCWDRIMTLMLLASTAGRHGNHILCVTHGTDCKHMLVGRLQIPDRYEVKASTGGWILSAAALAVFLQLVCGCDCLFSVRSALFVCSSRWFSLAEGAEHAGFLMLKMYRLIKLRGALKASSPDCWGSLSCSRKLQRVFGFRLFQAPDLAHFFQSNHPLSVTDYPRLKSSAVCETQVSFHPPQC